ncbi:hypothetical protein Val02_75550 [Virgisporangium aliadipatigenens]|uniref:Mycothiol-dependent maleylpyruvate isomerase metal-binding domain-containing protein n=1 Tax=Virgisporangium aliadipatigenens TaxID=741659 RepID=A0A8J3YS33_9ACTN|nr:maleylpyruvate isomerase family mycothiol-dependent enzyme [Virgisporangium aliadipatigenens]GIJ50669.1 hypothetical protein Val02_75550 [Virgisporangium aliadipatigenens]
MTADQVIAALRSGHDDLVAFVQRLAPADATKPSGADEWDVSQVLSHLGSGAEISLATLEWALAGEKPVEGFNQGVWDRWNAKTPAERVADFPAANQVLIEKFESLDPATRRDLRIDLGWMPQPVDVATAGTARLSEFTHHTWDVKVAFDPATPLAADAVPLLFAQTAFTLGWLAKPERLGKEATLTVHTTGVEKTFGLVLGEKAELTDAPERADGELRLPAEAWLRLVYGRLKPPYIPADVALTGPFTLDELRVAFPGF